MARLVVQRPIEVVGELQSDQEKAPDTLENYLERVSRYFPAEFVGAFVIFNNVVTRETSVGLVLGVYATLIVLNAVYMWRFAGPVRSKGKQVAIASVAFAAWSYGIGGAVWERIQSLSPSVELRDPLLTTMLPVLVSLGLAIYSPDGLVPALGTNSAAKRAA